MTNIIRTCNLTVRFLKFTLNIKIYKEFVEFLSKLVWRKTVFFLKYVPLFSIKKKGVRMNNELFFYFKIPIFFFQMTFLYIYIYI